MNSSLLRRTSAFAPIAMSLTALSFFLVYVALLGVLHHVDERAPARIFQLLIAGQIPIVAFFALKWLPRAPKSAVMVMALQAGAAVLALATVVLVER